MNLSRAIGWAGYADGSLFPLRTHFEREWKRNELTLKGRVFDFVWGLSNAELGPGSKLRTDEVRQTRQSSCVLEFKCITQHTKKNCKL